jgi:hypothetical protein
VVLVSALLVFGIVCAIAAWLVIREAARMSVEPPPPLFDPDEAFDWVVEHVPDDVAASLPPADVRRILDFQIEFLRSLGVTEQLAGVSSGELPPGEIILGDAETIEYIRARSRATGEAYQEVQVRAVVDTQLAYLRAIGALGGRAGPADGPDAS